jgi:hypothetical protein
LIFAAIYENCANHLLTNVTTLNSPNAAHPHKVYAIGLSLLAEFWVALAAF